MWDDSLGPLPYDAPPEAYAREVDALRAALAAHAQDVRDTIYDATPLGWAERGQCTRTYELLKELSAPR